MTLHTPLLLLLMFSLDTTAQTQADLVIKNGRIIDGTGNSWYRADIAIRNGRITTIGKNLQIAADRTINAENLFVTPGFIDVHAHIEGGIFERPTADNYIRDGVTTVVTGNCGNSYDDLGNFFHKIDSIRTSVNVASLAGHNTIRRLGMGLLDKAPTANEQRRMDSLMQDAMEDGAVGLSTGLIYLPGMYAKTDEIVSLARIAGRKGGVYATHMRNEGGKVTEAIDEAITIGREADIPVQISHFKVAGRSNWGRSVNTLGQVMLARDQGLDVTIDQYPYTASSTNLAVTVPDWSLDGGLDSLRKKIADQNLKKKIIREMVGNLKKSKNKNYSYAVVAMYGPDTTINGKNISEINKLRGRKAKPALEAETILDMLRKGNAQMVYHTMNEDDVQYFMKYPFNMPAADGGVSTGKGMPHPRGYGTNARVLGRYVREQKVISFEEAIRRMTSLPAQKFGLYDRGLLKEGFAADIVIFDPEKVTDKSTFEAPHQYTEGIPWVVVNGVPVVEDGQHNGQRSGRYLKKTGER
jgi:N-acyl-D-amino-acid deacylase